MMILQQTRGALSSGDQLALDLPFAATKSLTARIGPTPTFTRVQSTPTGTTFVGADGLIQYAAANQPRFDHDPLTLACKGLLIEESRTNLVFPSAALTTQTRTVTAATHTLSFYGSGTIVLSGTHSVTVVGTGAYPARRTLTFTPTAGSLTLTVTGTVELAQLEAGSFASSYIPTTTTSAVRSTDVCSITGSGFASLYNAPEGTLLVNAEEFRRGISYTPIVRIANSANAQSQRYQFGVYGNKSGVASPLEFVVTSNGSAFYSATPISSTSSFKAALAYSVDEMRGSLNGTLTVADTAPSALIIGANTFTINSVGGYVSSVRYYRRRLPNAKLQALTV